MPRLRSASLAFAALACSASSFAQTPVLKPLIERFATDENGLQQFYDLQGSPARRQRLDGFNKEWLAKLQEINFSALSQTDKVDYLLLRNALQYRVRMIDRNNAKDAEMAPLIPFAGTIFDLAESQQKRDKINEEQIAQTLTDLAKSIHDIRLRVRREGAKGTGANGEEAKTKEKPIFVKQTLGKRTADRVASLQRAFSQWYSQYEGYRPTFGWWVKKPYEKAAKELSDYVKLLKEDVAGMRAGDDSVMIGDPIGKSGLLEDLKNESIPYMPEELIRIAENEMAWCEGELKKAAREMGKGDDWKAALEQVKREYALPGEQDALTVAIVKETLEFLDKNNLVTIDPFCRETWKIQMLSPAEQKFLPFAAYGGQKIMVAYPTDEMDDEAKRMSLRANNIHFMRNVTPHELMPGHHLQGYMSERYASYRNLFRTPFLVEGWALYWEMRLYDLGFYAKPEDRIGNLFWRMHRGARIIVSLKFHLGEMTPQQMIDFLVDKVGHERDGATSEVRRFISGGYSPLYQCAYLTGGMQLYALQKELVGSGKMTERQFHDAILHQGEIPIEMMRSELLNQPLKHDQPSIWKFPAPHAAVR